MLNEAIETRGANELEIMVIPLSNNDMIKLELRFTNTIKKKYLLREALLIDNEVISEQVELAQIKSFMKKFIYNKLNSSHESKLFEYTTKQNPNGDILRSLKLKKLLGDKIYFSEVEIEAMLNIWLDALVGYSKIRVFDKNIVFSTNDYYASLDDGMIFTDVNRNINSKILQNLAHNEFDKSTIIGILENAKGQKLQLR